MLTFGSLFTGVGGFDLGFERAGMTCKWQCEINNQCIHVLKKHWPKIKRFKDVKENNPYSPVVVICGGDPCPIRSRARSNGKSRHPDLSGYFLAVVGRCRPRWVVRENVLAPDDKDFSTALELLGYGTVNVRYNSYAFTGQNRTRDFIVGCSEKTRFSRLIQLYQRKMHKRVDQEKYNPEESYPCLTTHACRYDARDGYIYEAFSGGLRVADKIERSRLAGFPDHWFEGMSKTAIARMTGNAVVVPVAEDIGKVISSIEQHSGF